MPFGRTPTEFQDIMSGVQPTNPIGKVSIKQPDPFKTDRSRIIFAQIEIVLSAYLPSRYSTQEVERGVVQPTVCAHTLSSHLKRDDLTVAVYQPQTVAMRPGDIKHQVETNRFVNVPRTKVVEHSDRKPVPKLCIPPVGFIHLFSTFLP
jgi:hypothetical protein